MPGGDRTGPMGMGPMTGRGTGYCAGYSTPGYTNSGPGRGFAGRGRGPGRGFGRGIGLRWTNLNFSGSSYSVQEESNLLKSEAAALQNQLNSINTRIKELESKT